MTAKQHDRALEWAREVAAQIERNPDLAAAIRFAMPDVVGIIAKSAKDTAPDRTKDEQHATRVSCPCCGATEGITEYYVDHFGGRLVAEEGKLYAHDRTWLGGGELESWNFANCAECNRNYELPYNVALAIEYDENPPSVAKATGKRFG